MSNLSADIYKKDLLAATFTKTDGILELRYRPEYIAANGRPIATTLPITAEPMISKGGAAPAYFSGLLPEGRRLSAIASRLKTSLDNDLALLLEIGSDLIGDVRVLPTGSTPQQTRDALMLPRDTSQINFKELRNSYFGLRATGIPGVQDKVSSKMLNARAKMANADYILKFDPDDVPHAVANEHYFLGLAKRCGIKVAKHELLTDGHGNHALLLERFDRIPTKTGKTMLAAEDGCQVLGLFPSEKYDLDFVTMATGLMGHCPARAVAGLELFKQLVFDWLIGNGDAHAKNFSILESSFGEWMVAPAYDLLCTRFYEDREMALAIDGHKSGWTLPLLNEVASKLLVPPKRAQKVLDEMLAELANLPNDIIGGALPFSRHLNYDVGAFLKQRRKGLAGSASAAPFD